MVTSIDLPSTSGGLSPYVMYQKLQQQIRENASKSSTSSAKDIAQNTLLEAKNSAIRVRNAQIKATNAEVVSDVDYFKNRAATATTVDELLNDDRALRVIAYATGLQDTFTFNKQRLKDVLKSDLTDANSVARQGTVKELEAAKKFDFGNIAASMTDTNGVTLTISAEGKVLNDGTGTVLQPGLAKIKNLVVTNSFQAALNGDGTVMTGGNLPGTVANDYSKARTKPLLQLESAVTSTSPNAYELDSAEFQRFRERSDIKREADYYRENIKNIKSVDDFFADKRLLRFALSAYGLESEAVNAGKMRKVLESDLTDVNSLANRLKDPRFQEIAKDFSFAVFKETKLKMVSTTDDIVRKYERVQYEKSLDDSSPGVRAALEFARRIKNVSQTVQLLGDSVMREVITVANNIPKELAIQEVESQVTAVEKKVDVTKFKDQAEVDKTVQRYLLNKSSQEAGITGGNGFLLKLFG